MSESHSEHSFNQETVGTIRVEMERIANIWNAYLLQLTDSSVAVGIHPPPALCEFYTEMLDRSNPLEPLFIEGEPCNVCPRVPQEAVDTVMYTIMSFGDLMFRFGQYASARGLLHSNMTQCNCGSVDDSALAKLLHTEDPKA
jgi:hypothetical protein